VEVAEGAQHVGLGQGHAAGGRLHVRLQLGQERGSLGGVEGPVVASAQLLHVAQGVHVALHQPELPAALVGAHVGGRARRARGGRRGWTESFRGRNTILNLTRHPLGLFIGSQS
jgi:hypothetical protein